MNKFVNISFGLAVAFMLSVIGVAAQTNSGSVKDTQDLAPEKIEGIVVIEPDYKNDDKVYPPIGRVGVDLFHQRPISVRDVVIRALENNKDIELSRKDIRIAEFDYQSSFGFFAKRITGETYYENASTPNASVFNQSTTVSNTALVSTTSYVDRISKWGTQFTGTFSTRRTTTDNPLTTLSPQYDSSLRFQIVQPLFRGRKMDDARRTIELTKSNLGITDAQFHQRAIDVSASVEKAYWDLVFALRNLQVQRDAVRDAKEQLDHNKRLVEGGILAPIDVVAAETQVANLEQNIYIALDTVNRIENGLKTMIAVNAVDPIWSEALVPTDSVVIPKPNTNLDESLALAFENRYEFDVLDIAKKNNEYDQAFYKDQLKPEINFVASYTSSGISGSANSGSGAIFSGLSNTAKLNEIITRVNLIDPTRPPIALIPVNTGGGVPSSITGNYFSSLSDIIANRYPTFRVGVNYNFNLDSDAQEAQLGKSLVQSEKIKTQREQLTIGVQVEVRNALQAIRTNEAKLRAATISRENSFEQYESERRKLDSGLSDIYKVLERQTAFVVARSTELQARTDLNKSIVELERVTGVILKRNDLETRLTK